MSAFFVVLNAFVGLVAIIGNALILVVVFTYHQSMAASYFHLTAILAASDLLVGFGSILGSINAVQGMGNFTKSGCLLQGTPLIYGTTSGQVILLFVCLDRLYATLKPLEYTLITHNKLTKFGALITFIYTTASISCMFVGVDLDSKPPMCGIALSLNPHYKVYLMSSRFIASLVIICGYLAIITSLWCFKDRSETLSTEQRNTQVKATKVASMVIVVYLCSWVIPNGLFTGGIVLGAGGETVRFLGEIIGAGSVINSSANIFIYALKHNTFKKNLFKLFGKQQAQSTVQVQMNVHPRSNNRASSRGQEAVSIHSM